jgi:transposase
LIARLRLEIEKLRRSLYGVRSECKERLLDQLEMQLEDIEADAIENELAAERAAPSTVVNAFERRRSARKPFPEHLPRSAAMAASAFQSTIVERARITVVSTTGIELGADGGLSLPSDWRA